MAKGGGGGWTRPAAGNICISYGTQIGGVWYAQIGEFTPAMSKVKDLLPSPGVAGQVIVSPTLTMDGSRIIYYYVNFIGYIDLATGATGTIATGNSANVLIATSNSNHCVTTNNAGISGNLYDNPPYPVSNQILYHLGSNGGVLNQIQGLQCGPQGGWIGLDNRTLYFLTSTMYLHHDAGGGTVNLDPNLHILNLYSLDTLGSDLVATKVWSNPGDGYNSGSNSWIYKYEAPIAGIVYLDGTSQWIYIRSQTLPGDFAEVGNYPRYLLTLNESGAIVSDVLMSDTNSAVSLTEGTYTPNWASIQLSKDIANNKIYAWPFPNNFNNLQPRGLWTTATPLSTNTVFTQRVVEANRTMPGIMGAINGPQTPPPPYIDPVIYNIPVDYQMSSSYTMLASLVLDRYDSADLYWLVSSNITIENPDTTTRMLTDIQFRVSGGAVGTLLPTAPVDMVAYSGLSTVTSCPYAIVKAPLGTGTVNLEVWVKSTGVNGIISGIGSSAGIPSTIVAAPVPLPVYNSYTSDINLTSSLQTSATINITRNSAKTIQYFVMGVAALKDATGALSDTSLQLTISNVRNSSIVGPTTALTLFPTGAATALDTQNVCGIVTVPSGSGTVTVNLQASSPNANGVVLLGSTSQGAVSTYLIAIPI